MSKSIRRYWHEYTWPEFKNMDHDNTVAILPVGAIEQHGPHLPVYTDSCINHEMLSRFVQVAPEDLNMLILPMQTIGKSNEHMAYPGTLTLSYSTLAQVLIEIGESVNRAGIRRLVFLNSHGGQPQVLDIVARELRVRHKMFVVHMGLGAVGKPAGLASASEMKHGIHGGAMETSMMLYLRPDLVKMEFARNFVPSSIELEMNSEFLTPEGRIGFGWQTQDLHPAGAAGNATLADPEKGRLVVEHFHGRFAQLLREIIAYPLSNIRDRISLD